jgi:catechol 2,3-dioxygenase-like lactoylglutathione lyase family enzyme
MSRHRVLGILLFGISLLATAPLIRKASPAAPRARVTAAASQNAPQVTRPPLVGISHLELKTDNLEAGREFYGHVLGFEAVRGTGQPLMTVFVNNHQYIDVRPGLESPTEDRLSHLAFETTDARRLRDYLAGRGVNVPPAPSADPEGRLAFMVKDPDGHSIEFIQYAPGAMPLAAGAKDLSAHRISERIIHAGVTVRDRDAADRFYRDILGFRMIWHGGRTDDRTDWVDMRVPEGTDWLEYMLNVSNPSPHTLGVMHHFALGVPSVARAYETVVGRGFRPPKEPQIGRDGKWQLNLYDPNDTRVELMEPKPVQTPCCSPILEEN